MKKKHSDEDRVQRLETIKNGDLRVVPETYNDWLETVGAKIKTGPFYTFNYYGALLKYVPEMYKTPELCREAVENEGSALEFVPEALKTAELCRAAVRCRHTLGMGSDWEGYGASLKFVPDDIKTRELCFDALLNQGAFDDVPEAIKTRDFCIDVLSERRYGYTKADKTMVNSVPDTFKSSDFYFEVIQRQRQAFEYVPDEYKTTEMCLFAVEYDVYSGGWVSENAYYTYTVPELSYVPDALKTEELCLAAVKQNWHALEFVPDTLKTGEMCRIAVLACGNAQQYVPKSLIPSMVMEISVAGQDGDTIMLADDKTGRSKKIHQSLISDNELTIENGAIKISPSLYNSWFTL
ncbi:MAG: DUF4116 domain-containing protein [Treponema sp.]|jgi:hypothetical protein|nr:DUF4116 domain-containing protein [Treponema sp.]